MHEQLKEFIGKLPEPYELRICISEEKLAGLYVCDSNCRVRTAMLYPDPASVLFIFTKYKGLTMEELLNNEDFKEDMSMLPKFIKFYKNYHPDLGMANEFLYTI